MTDVSGGAQAAENRRECDNLIYEENGHRSKIGLTGQKANQPYCQKTLVRKLKDSNQLKSTTVSFTSF